LHTKARRSRARARLITIGALVGAIVVVLGGALGIAAAGGPRGGILVAHAVASVAVLSMLIGFASTTTRLAQAMDLLAERHPGAVVFLARRLPPVVSDLPAYLKTKGLDVEIGDRWYPAVADRRGIAVFSPTRDPRELLVMEWPEIGDVEMVRTPTVGGDYRWSVTVDVKPYVVPLTADLGVAWGLVTMGLDAADTAAIVKAVIAQRPS
jgi:hypothetical protein